MVDDLLCTSAANIKYSQNKKKQNKTHHFHKDQKDSLSFVVF